MLLPDSPGLIKPVLLWKTIPSSSLVLYCTEHTSHTCPVTWFRKGVSNCRVLGDYNQNTQIGPKKQVNCVHLKNKCCSVVQVLRCWNIDVSETDVFCLTLTWDTEYDSGCEGWKAHPPQDTTDIKTPVDYPTQILTWKTLLYCSNAGPLGYHIIYTVYRCSESTTFICVRQNVSRTYFQTK